jgi:methionine aminopeptidase
MNLNPNEAVGLKFNLDDYSKAQEKTRVLTREFAKLIKPGMPESIGKNLLEKFLDDSGLEKRWHPTKFRMGVNTVCNFRDNSEEYILKENDIFFVDIGPVYYDHEGDYGETFTVGSDPQLDKLRDATQIIFQKTQAEWRKKNLTGNALYEFADYEASKLGLRLNSNMYGHRLGDFPHAVFSKRKLGSLEFTPAANLWVLEVHLIDDQIKRGAFFEDILA